MTESSTFAEPWTRTERFERFGGHHSPVLRWQPHGGARAHAIFFPPYGDEMNQARRMYRLTAEALAAAGIGACLFDLMGTGDSTAGFELASVQAWLDDCSKIVEPLARQPLPLVFIGCRLGAALAARTSRVLDRPVDLLVGWAPLWKGAQQLSGLLRAARMARLTRAQGSDATPADPKGCWARGASARLAGYPVSARLAAELDALDATEAPRARRAALFDVRAFGPEDAGAPGDALRARADAWSQRGVATDARAVDAPAFWNVVDLVDAPALVDATVRAARSAVSTEAVAPVGGDA